MRLFAAVALLAAGTAAAQSSSEDEQRRAARALEPDPLQPPALGAGRVQALKVRLYADSDYRAGLFRWAERARAQLSQLNQFLEPEFGVRLEAESFRRWHRPSGMGDIYGVLDELAAHDPGQGVDWVVAFVTPLPVVSSSMHALGAARTMGKHFVLRGMASPEEAQALGRSLDKMDVAEREGLYARRKWHKETAIFLHEWFHTLGALHSGNPRRLMHPSYSNQMSDLSPEDAQLVALAIAGRIKARARAGASAYSELRGFLERTTSPEWDAKERAQLLSILAATGASVGAAPSPPRGTGDGALSKEQVETFDRAVRLLNEGKEGEAWAEVRPLGVAVPRSAEIQRLLCRPSHVKEARKEGEVACQRARELDPTRPDPLVDEAQAQILREEHGAALKKADEAAARARRLGPGGEASWLSIAPIYGQLGALTRAEECLKLARDARPEVASGLREAVQRDRRDLGLPATGEFQLPPEKEPRYAERLRGVRQLVGERKLREARAAVVEAMREFPGAPGLLVAACELELHQRRTREGERLCTQALGVWDELPRAHYLLGHSRLRAGKTDEAIASLRRARELDPQDAAAWETLADVFRMAGKRDELGQLRAEQEKAFGRALP